MDVQWGSTADEAPIWQWPCNGTGAQAVSIESVGGGYYQIRFPQSGKCVDVPGGSHEIGVQLWQYTCNGTDAQKFNVASSQGSKRTLVNKGSNLCIDVAGASTDDGAAIWQWDCNGGTNQVWGAMPPNSHSWYIKNTGYSSMYNMGKNDAIKDGSTCADSLVVLDFGQPEKGPAYYYGGYGTNDFATGNPWIDDGTIALAATYYTDGWYAYAGCAHLRLVVGLNNYHQCPSGGSCDPYYAGWYWGDVVYDVRNYVSSHGYSSKITAVWGGSDMEQGSGYDCADRTRDLVDGFNDHDPSGASFINYGTNWSSSCWTSNDVYYVSYDATHDYPLPEIYSSYAADSWVALRGAHYMSFKGAMTECQQGDPLPNDYCSTPSGDFAPRAGWRYFWSHLNWNGSGQSQLQYTTNIRSP
jgi:Ricin-type beta-trefoil lectin domain-like